MYETEVNTSAIGNEVYVTAKEAEGILKKQMNEEISVESILGLGASGIALLVDYKGERKVFKLIDLVVF